MVYPLLILAHVLADFTFQSKKISEKKQVHFGALLKHVLIVFITSLVLTIHYYSSSLLVMILVISAVHGFIDYWKIFLMGRYKGRYELELFLTDQILHILMIFVIVPLYYLPLNQEILSIFLQIKHKFDWLLYLNISRIGFIAIFAAVIIFNFKGGTILVRNTLKKYKSNLSSEGDKGKAIGNLERLLTILFVVLGYYSLIGLLFTAKSLIRFKEIETKDTEEGFVEYYLIGSFTSLFLAVLTGNIIKVLSFLW